MRLTERERHDAYEAMAKTFGPKTDIVIAMLQPVTNLATRDDLAAAIAPLATKDELAAAVAPLASKDELAAAVAPLATKDELKVAVSELRADMAELRMDFKSEIHGETAKQTRLLVFALLTAIIVSGALNSMTILLQS